MNVPSSRQPIHTVYGGAHLFRPDTPRKLGLIAVRTLFDTVHDAFAFAEAFGLPESASLPSSVNGRMSLLRRFTRMGARARRVHPQAWFVFDLYQRIVQKLRDEPVEDYRVDFEDGYGFRSDAEEDRHAVESADSTAEAMIASSLPPFFGIRIKPLSGRTRARAERTLSLYLHRLIEQGARGVPPHFVVTIPKVDRPSELREAASLISRLESDCGLRARSILLEAMIERPQLLSDPEGRVRLRDLIPAADGRLRGAHLGLYDYLSALGIPSAIQDYRHPLADHLRAETLGAFAESGVMVSDGASNTIPTPLHTGAALTDPQRRANEASIVGGWRSVFANVEHSLRFGYMQGWDLHPSQFIPRYTAVYAMYRREKEAAAARLRTFLQTSAHARVHGQQFDDIATGWGLMQFFAKGRTCGAFDDTDLADAGLSAEELALGTVAEVLRHRTSSHKKRDP